MNVPGPSLAEYGRKPGVRITFGIVFLAVLGNQAYFSYQFVDPELLLVGPVLAVMWAAVSTTVAIVAGAIGGGYASRRESPDARSGARLGGTVGAVGNLGAALVGVVLALAITTAFFVTGRMPPESEYLPTLGLALLIGFVGIVSGTVVAGVGGAAGGVLAAVIGD